MMYPGSYWDGLPMVFPAFSRLHQLNCLSCFFFLLLTSFSLSTRQTIWYTRIYHSTTLIASLLDLTWLILNLNWSCLNFLVLEPESSLARTSAATLSQRVLFTLNSYSSSASSQLDLPHSVTLSLFGKTREELKKIETTICYMLPTTASAFDV